MNLKLLHKGTEEERRWKIVDVSKNRDSRYLPQLYARLKSEETIENKRHIIRALGQIGSKESAPILIELITQSKGLVLGDLCQALANLEAVEAMEYIEKLVNHRESWVRQEANGALKKLRNAR